MWTTLPTASRRRQARALEFRVAGLTFSAAMVLMAGLGSAAGLVVGSLALLLLGLASAAFGLATIALSAGVSGLTWGRGWSLAVGWAFALAWGAALGVGGWAGLAPGLVAVAGVIGLAARSAELPERASANLWGWLFVLPAFALLAVWHFGPAGYALWLSFFDKVNFLRPAEFSGLENYLALARDPLFWKSLGNSAWYTFGTVPTGILIATAVAVLLNERVRGLSLFRTVFFLPYITALTAAAAVWRWIYNPEFGVLNAVLGTPGQEWLNNPNGVLGLLAGGFGVSLPSFLQGPSVALVAVMAMSIWHQLGYSVVILLAGLQSVPREYYEAASLDGASWWQQVRHVTWPLLTPTTFFLAITGVIGSFQVFTQILVLTPNGGVLGDTLTVVKYLYDKGFRDSNFSYASAMAFALFVLVVAATLVQNRILAQRVTYDL